MQDFIVPGTNGMSRFWRLNASGVDEIGWNTLSVSNTTYKKTPRGYQTYCATANGSSSSLTSGVTVSGVRTVFFSIYPTSNNRTFLTATGITITINSSSQIATSGLTGVSVSVNGQPTTSIVLNAWNFVAVSHDSANYASVNIFASSFIGDAQEVGMFDRVISETEIRNWYLENLRSLGGSTLAGLMDGLVAKFDTTDGNVLEDVVWGVAVTKTSWTAATDNLGYIRAITNPNYSWPSVTYTTGYVFENLGSGWVLTQSPSGLSATGINRTTTLREVFLFSRTLSADEKNALETICKLNYVLPFDWVVRYWLPSALKDWCVLFIPWEVSGTTAYDASWNGNHGTLVNTPTPARGGLYGYKGLKFNGTSQYVTLPSINPSEFTVSITVAVNQTSSLRWIVTKYYLDNVPLSSWWVDTASNLFRFWIWGSGWDDVLTTNFNPTLWQNYRLTTVYSSGSMKIYVNGVLNNSKSTSIVPHTNSTNVLIWAFNWASPMFFGDMRAANLLITNRALSADEIRLDASTFFVP